MPFFFRTLFLSRLDPHRDNPFLTFLLVGSAGLIVRVTNMWPCEGANGFGILVIW